MFRFSDDHSNSFQLDTEYLLLVAEIILTDKTI